LMSSTRNIYNCNIETSSSSIDKNENEDIEVPEKKKKFWVEPKDALDSEEVTVNMKNGLKLNMPMPGTSLNSKVSTTFRDNDNSEFKGSYNRIFTHDNENLEKNQITQFDTLNKYLISGNNNGMLTIWDLESTELLSNKQLFGIITGVKCKEEGDLIVTSHASKAYDIGCISIRKMVTPTELTVVWSAYQDVMPVFCMDVSTNHILTLEWLGTFDMVHVGSATCYTRHGDHLFVRKDFSQSRAVESRRSVAGLIGNLQNQQNLRYYSGGIFKEDFAALCTDFEPFGAQQVVIYNLNDLTLIRSFSGHNCGVLQVVSFGNIFVTRDKEGIIIIWDANNACDENKEETALMKTLELPHKDKFIHVDVDLRRLVIGRLGGVEILDFWNSSLQNRQ